MDSVKNIIEDTRVLVCDGMNREITYDPSWKVYIDVESHVINRLNRAIRPIEDITHKTEWNLL
jgi:hypothetical protein